MYGQKSTHQVKHANLIEPSSSWMEAFWAGSMTLQAYLILYSSNVRGPVENASNYINNVYSGIEKIILLIIKICWSLVYFIFMPYFSFQIFGANSGFLLKW